MALKLYNTMGHRMEEFKPVRENYVGFYGCGPTVYNYAHIGNLRAYVFLDILDRTLTFLGYDKKHVMNITDVGHLTGDNDNGHFSSRLSMPNCAMILFSVSAGESPSPETGPTYLHEHS